MNHFRSDLTELLALELGTFRFFRILGFSIFWEMPTSGRTDCRKSEKIFDTCYFRRVSMGLVGAVTFFSMRKKQEVGKRR